MKYNEKLTTQDKFEKTKTLLDKMITDRRKGKPVAESAEITQIFKDLQDKRRSMGKTS